MNLEVGKPYLPIMGRGEGAIFDANEGGYLLIYNFDNPKQSEIAQMGSGSPFEIAFTSIGGAIWILTKCGTLEWTDAPYHPALSLYADKLLRPTGEDGTALTLVMTDARDATVKSIRMIGLGHNFSDKLYHQIVELAEKPFNLLDYNRNLNNTMMAYSTRALLNMSTARWKLR